MSDWYRALPKILLALVALQRGIRFARNGASAVRSMFGAATLALILELILALTIFGAGVSVDLALSLVVDVIIMAAFGFLGARLAGRASH